MGSSAIKSKRAKSLIQLPPLWEPSSVALAQKRLPSNGIRRKNAVKNAIRNGMRNGETAKIEETTAGEMTVMTATTTAEDMIEIGDDDAMTWNDCHDATS